MNDHVHPASQAFGGVASTYHRARPSYPEAAVDHLRRALGLESGGSVLDLGAGTGKLTEQVRLAGVPADTPAHRDETWRQAIEADQRYAPLQVAHFNHDQIADQELLSERVASISFVAALPDVERVHLLTQLRRVVTTLGLPVRFPLRYVTEVHTTRLQ